MNLTKLIETRSGDLAFIVGNGINRFAALTNHFSWDDLLISLWEKFSFHTVSEIPKGISLTEFYDLLEMEMATLQGDKSGIQKEVCRLLKDLQVAPHHRLFLEKACAMGTPVLTTNFDLLLPQALELTPYFMKDVGFTDYYPWSAYYGNRQLANPVDGFGVWFINGFIHYHRSIRLGLSHYMGSVERARQLIYKDNGLYRPGLNNRWQGSSTWLDLVFHRSLCIFGLNLEENEVFLRWLLIERAKYYRKFPERKKKGWYVIHQSEYTEERYLGKKFFFEKLGFELIEVDSYEDIYRTPWERLGLS